MYEIKNNILKVSREMENKSGVKEFTINKGVDTKVLSNYLDASIDKDGNNYILGNIKKELVPSGILTAIPSKSEQRQESLELMMKGVK